jgi:hypothetical protein
MRSQSYRMRRETFAVFTSQGSPAILTIPCGGTITLSQRASSKTGTVEVTWGNKLVKMFAADLDRRGERVSERHK